MATNILLTPNAEHLGKKFERDERAAFSDSEVLYFKENSDGKRVFPNGEPYSRFDSEDIDEGDYVALIHSSQPNPEFVKKYCDDALGVLRNDVRPGHLDFIMTHCAEQMQDDKFNKGEANSARNEISNYLQLYSDKYIDPVSGGIRKNPSGVPMRIVVLNPHFSQKEWTKPFEEEGLLEIMDMSDRFKKVIEDRYDEPVFYVGPDDTAMERFEGDASLEKTRRSSTDVTHEEVWYQDLADMVLDEYDSIEDKLDLSEVKKVLMGEKKSEELDTDYLSVLEEDLDQKVWNLIDNNVSLDQVPWVLIDDTVETGGTQSSAISKLRELGARDVALASIHVEDIVPVNLFRKFKDYEDSKGSLKDFVYDFWSGKLVHELPEVKEGRISEEDYSSMRDVMKRILRKDEEELYEDVKRNRRGIDRLLSDMRYFISNSSDLKKMGINLGHPNINDNVIDVYPPLSVLILEKAQEI